MKEQGTMDDEMGLSMPNCWKSHIFCVKYMKIYNNSPRGAGYINPKVSLSPCRFLNWSPNRSTPTKNTKQKEEQAKKAIHNVSPDKLVPRHLLPSNRLLQYPRLLRTSRKARL